VEFVFEHSGSVRTLPPAHESDLLRIAQEAVSNAMRHASARRVLMELHYLPETIRLRIGDDGKGFSVGTESRRSGHFGLQGMEERARQIGAELKIESRLGAGTVVIVQLSESAFGEHSAEPSPERALASSAHET
jgi:signal transduction histidine kinase